MGKNAEGYHKDYYQRNKQKYLDQLKERTATLGLEKRKILAEFQSGGCFFCEEFEPICLDAHHVDPTLKKFEISAALKNVVSINNFKLELQKCICVCSNCHRKIHAGLIMPPKHCGDAQPL